MPYQADIPQPTDQLSKSQSDLLANFRSINTWCNVNHVNFNAGADAGKHKWVTFPREAVVPTPPFGASELSLYNILNATSGVSELYVQKGVAAGIPFTLSRSVAASTGWTYLPSGMKIVWGQDTIAGGNATKTTLFASVAAFPGFSGTALGIQITRVHNATSNNFIQLDSFTNLQFIARRSTSSTGSADIYVWMAIGV